MGVNVAIIYLIFILSTIESNAKKNYNQNSEDTKISQNEKSAISANYQIKKNLPNFLEKKSSALTINLSVYNSTSTNVVVSNFNNSDLANTNSTKPNLTDIKSQIHEKDFMKNIKNNLNKMNKIENNFEEKSEHVEEKIHKTEISIDKNMKKNLNKMKKIENKFDEKSQHVEEILNKI